MASNRQWCVSLFSSVSSVALICALFCSHLHVDGFPPAGVTGSPNRAPESSLRRITVLCFPAAYQRCGVPEKTAALQPASCRPLPHRRPPRRHQARPNLHRTILHQMLTFVILLQSPAS
jgi:hypothetical protein